MRIPVLCLSVLALLGAVVPAKAGDYYSNGYGNGGYYNGYRNGGYYNGYRYGGYGNVYYSSRCCYQKVIRHETTSRFVRLDEGPYYRGNGYNGYYGRPYRSSYYYDQPRRYVDDNYYAARRYIGYGNGGYSGYSSYSAYAQNCYSQRVRVEDGRGGWVWSSRRVCH
jgi:hypothetical protein